MEAIREVEQQLRKSITVEELSELMRPGVLQEREPSPHVARQNQPHPSRLNRKQRRARAREHVTPR